MSVGRIFYSRPVIWPSTPYWSKTSLIILFLVTALTICNKRRLTASDCPEGNRRDYSMSGNQTSGKGGGVQGVLTVVCMYIYLISYMSD